MAVIDAHAHIYPEKIASKAVDAVGAFYGVEMFDGGACSPGTPEALLACTNESPITHFIVHSVATTSHAAPASTTSSPTRRAGIPSSSGSAPCIPISRTRKPRSTA